MDQFDIIGALEAYATANSWLFTYGVDNYYKSAQSIQDYTVGKHILIADFRATPTIKNGRIMSISYTCLLMLGRKFDPTGGTSANLDETSDQKYDRRLKELMQLLAACIGTVACDNDLEVTAGEMVVNINQYAENLDFAAATNVIFIQ